MSILKDFWNKVFPGTYHDGTIDFDESCDIPPAASRPAPLESNPVKDEALWQEFIDLASRPAPLKDAP